MVTEGVQSVVSPLVSRCPGTSEQVKSDKEEHMMSQSRGAVSFEPLFTAEEIGLGKEAHVEHVMKVLRHPRRGVGVSLD
jgi:hypothetical protein